MENRDVKLKYDIAPLPVKRQRSETRGHEVFLIYVPSGPNCSTFVQKCPFMCHKVPTKLVTTKNSDLSFRPMLSLLLVVVVGAPNATDRER